MRLDSKGKVVSKWDQPGAIDELGHLMAPSATAKMCPALVHIDPVSGVIAELPLTEDDQEWRRIASTSVPDIIVFSGVTGYFTLVGCRRAGSKSNILNRHGVWKISADYVIVGYPFIDDTIKKISGLRSHITGLHTFMGWAGTAVDLEHGSDGLVSGITLRSLSTPPVRLTLPSGQVDIHASSRMVEEGELKEYSYIESSVDEVATWDRHLDFHKAIRELVALTLWQAVDFTGHQIRHPEAPDRVLSGDVYGPGWRNLYGLARTRQAHGVQPDDFQADALGFGFKDVGSEGMLSWFKVRAEYQRALSPLLSYLYLKILPIESEVLHVGVCIEHLRFTDAVNSGLSPSKANSENFATRAQRLVEQVGEPLLTLVRDTAAWSQALAKSYNSIKHANRDQVDPADAFWLARSGALVARARFLQLCGVPSSSLQRLDEHHWWGTLDDRLREILLT